MANSGTITGSFSGGSASAKFTYKCNWAIESQDIAARTSYVRFQWIVYKTDYPYRTWKGSTPWAATIDGTTTAENISFESPASYSGSDQIFKTTYATIPHNANGTKTVAISSTLDLSGTSAGTGNLSGNITLNAIPVTPPAINSFAVSDASGTQLASGVYVATKSIMRLTATATAYGGATIAKYDFYRDDTFLGSSTNGVYTATATAIAGEYVYKVIVTDSYGITATRTLAAVTVYPYSLPTITSTTTFRSNSSGTQSTSGTYASVKAVWEFASCGGHNTVTARAIVNNVSATLTNNTASVINARLSENVEYNVLFIVTDAFGSEAKVYEPIRSGFKNFNLYRDNTKGGFAFGEAAQLDKGIFNVGEVIFRGDATIEGDLNLPAPLPIASGGTGGVSIVSNKSNFTSTSWNFTGTTYTVHGSGYVIATASVWSGTTASYGSTAAKVEHNGTIVALSGNRSNETVDHNFGATATAMFPVSDGDTIYLGGFCSRTEPTKTLNRMLMCFGCTVS